MPPPFDLVFAGTTGQFLNTTGAPSGMQNDPVRAERSHYFDLGVSHTLAPGFVLGLDGYYKFVHNLIDESQFGAPIILAAFNYRRAPNCGWICSMSATGSTRFAMAPVPRWGRRDTGCVGPY